MFQWILKKMKNNKGFTLVELIVVIAILGVLAGIAVPKLSESRKRAAITAHNANVRTLEGAATMYIAENDLPAAGEEVEWTEEGGATNSNKSDDNGKWTLYLQKWPEIPKGAKDLKGRDGSTDYTEGNYKVTIDSKGEIIVEPIAIELDKDNQSDS